MQPRAPLPGPLCGHHTQSSIDEASAAAAAASPSMQLGVNSGLASQPAAQEDVQSVHTAVSISEEDNMSIEYYKTMLQQLRVMKTDAYASKLIAYMEPREDFFISMIKKYRIYDEA